MSPYGANELNPVEADFPELDNISMQRLSLREAAKTQSVVDVVSGRQTKCVCQSACLSSRAVVEKLNRNVTYIVTKQVPTVRIFKHCKRYCD